MNPPPSFRDLINGLENHLNELSREVESIETDQSLRGTGAVATLILAGLTYALGGDPAWMVVAAIAIMAGLMMLEPAARKRALAEQIMTLEERLIGAGLKFAWTKKKRRHDICKVTIARPD